MKKARQAWLGLLLVFVGACGNSSSNSFDPKMESIPGAVSGSISGLTASGLVLQNNQNDLLIIPAYAQTFIFTKRLPEGGLYAVSIQSQPTGLNCVVSDPSGVVDYSVNLQVTCARYGYVQRSIGGNFDLTECVKDYSNGLIWEGKTNEGFRSGKNRYTNYQIGYTDGIGNSVSQTDVDAASNAIAYINAINQIKLCGFDDWRLPTSAELLTLVTKSQNPPIDTTWFPNTQASSYWTSSRVTSLLHSNDVEIVSFSELFRNWGARSDSLRRESSYVRLVRDAT